MMRGELKRTPFAPAQPKPAKGPRQKKCAHCREPFVPRTSLAVACSVDCAMAVAAAVKVIAERKSDKVRKLALKTRQDWIRETQTEFNAVIRLRDKLAGYACISSGKPLDWSGNNVDAGHYRSVGSAPHLRFNKDNVHAQSKQENRYASGNAVDYRVGLIARIGLARVEALESDQARHKWTIEELKAIKTECSAELKRLKEKTS